MSLTITLRNVSNLAEVSDYHYEVSINTRVIESGLVRGHNRSDGWDGLLLLLGSEREVHEQYANPGPAPSRPFDPHYRPVRNFPKPKKGK